MAAENEQYFSEAEIYQALSWGMSDAEARRMAKYMSDDPAVMATAWPPEERLGTHMYSDGFLLVMSLLSDATNRKVETRLLDSRLGKELSPEERAKWEERRAKLRAELIQAGKIRE